MVQALGSVFPDGNFTVDSDARVALTAGIGAGEGIVLIAGTGSVAFGRNSAGQEARAGGWGPTIGDEGSAADALAASAYFRGHTLISKLPIRVVSEAGAPALTYLHQNAGAGRIRIRSDRVDQEALNLLFVLDCSGSMSLPDELGESRMGSLRSVLAEFAAALTEPDVRVGVRLRKDLGVLDVVERRGGRLAVDELQPQGLEGALPDVDAPHAFGFHGHDRVTPG